MKKRELLELINTGEGLTLEFKERLSADFGKEICALANSQGERILLGVKDNGQIAGINSTNSLKSKIQSIARNIDPKLSIDISEIDNVLIIKVPDGSEKPYSVNGQFFMRIGANCQKLTRNEVKEFFQKENLILFDNQPNKSFDIENDLDKEKFNYFLKSADITYNLNTKDVLRNLFLLDGEHLKNAGVLFFTSEIKKFFLNATISCLLYQGNSKSRILDRKEFHSDIISNYDNAFIYLLSKLNTNYIIKKERTEKLELPEEALREALINAIVHRDYFSNGHIQIDIFLDRVEFSNPGGLINGISEKDFGKVSLTRNPLIMDLMLRINKVEKAGTGINRIKDSMKEYGLKVKFELTDFFRVVFYRPMQAKASQKTVEKTVEKILVAMKQNPIITQNNLMQITGLSRRGVEWQIKKLKGNGEIKRIGSDKGGHWVVND